jgi:DNA-binding LytR/AlgR family response regulator
VDRCGIASHAAGDAVGEQHDMNVLVVERERRLYLLDPGKIDYIESYGNYVRSWSGAIPYLSRDCIKALAQQLAPCAFVRIQRSKLINLHAVSYIERPGHGLFVFALTSGIQLESTATYRAEILRALYPDNAREAPDSEPRLIPFRPGTVRAHHKNG